MLIHLQMPQISEVISVRKRSSEEDMRMKWKVKVVIESSINEFTVRNEGAEYLFRKRP